MAQCERTVAIVAEDLHEAETVKFDKPVDKTTTESAPASPALDAPAPAPLDKLKETLPGTDIKDSVKDNCEANGVEANNNEPSALSRLEEEVQKRTNERDTYQKKLEEAEKKLGTLQSSYNALISGEGNEVTLRKEMEDLKNALTQTQLRLDDRGRLMANQENQINALTKQVSSLKEVVSITKDLLNIRNMEVKHLQDDVDNMESRIAAERERHNAMLSKMNEAERLNSDLRQEYETQLKIFQDLRGKYEEKVNLLSEENRALESAAHSARS
ncbi:centrosomal protein of 112 kDa isoform X2 [Orussus abietinus]|uniref:centrosomal protein of 112 kDa isoform X2 n=2 Tax=Orussus abietinus TaxID=222816 RepID=UPI0006255BFB|nr:centrosomal protein of 112 kDa isoform X2 [Orussus abietinus]XP_012276700.1 centrosomal protein of 112 kDa isoform X2 [Orussus abietinus]